MFKKLLVPVDGSDQSLQAAKVAANIADKHEGHINLLYVIRPYAFEYSSVDTGINPSVPELPGGTSSVGKQILEKIKQEIQTSGTDISIELSQGNPSKVICEKAQEGSYDLIVMGSRGLSGLRSNLLGSVSYKVSQEAPCPVLLARLGKEETNRIVKEVIPDYQIYL